MGNHSYNPNVQYDEDEEFTITGTVINSISKTILDLRKQVKGLKDAELASELEDLRIRDRNPAVKDAWDKYQTVLGLARK